MLVPVMLMSCSGIYMWLAMRYNMLSFYKWTMEMSYTTYYFSKCLLVLMEFGILCVTLGKMKMIDSIYQQFTALDDAFEKICDVKFNSKACGRKILVVLLLTILLIAVYVIKYFRDADYEIVVLEVLIVHMISVKGISFMFFVDAFNERLSAAVEMIKSAESMNCEFINLLHHQLYQLSRSILQVYGTTISVLTFFYCTSIPEGFYQFFVSASGIETYYYSPYGKHVYTLADGWKTFIK